jgi:hypothetical protein
MLITGVTKTPENCVKVLSLLEACFDLISGSSLHMKIQITRRKITENPEGQIVFVLFSFHFQILTKKVDILFLTTF